MLRLMCLRFIALNLFVFIVIEFNLFVNLLFIKTQTLLNVIHNIAYHAIQL